MCSPGGKDKKVHWGLSYKSANPTFGRYLNHFCVRQFSFTTTNNCCDHNQLIRHTDLWWLLVLEVPVPDWFAQFLVVRQHGTCGRGKLLTLW